MAENAGWLPLHLAVAEGCEEGVVRRVRKTKKMQAERKRLHKQTKTGANSDRRLGSAEIQTSPL